MARLDLAFFLCCCNAFFRADSNNPNDDYYGLLEIDSEASSEEIKKAYKKQSLLMHPDKLAQRGQVATDADRERFQLMKHAYEILSDPHKRDTYDAIGAKGLKWVDEPFSINPQELAHNFATSSVIDRLKIFGIFVAMAIAIFVQPALICLMVDGHLGDNASWFGVLTPLWLWNAFILFYHARVIMMGPIQKPDHIPEEEWTDPLPMSRRVFSLFRFLLVVVFEVFVTLKLTYSILWSWGLVFIPLFLWEAITVFKKLPIARMRIITLDQLELMFAKPFEEMTDDEKLEIAKNFAVVPSLESPAFVAASKAKATAQQDLLKVAMRLAFLVLVIIQLDFNLSLSWWAIFTPIWVMSFLICYGGFRDLEMVSEAAMKRDPDVFGEGWAERLKAARGGRQGDEDESQTGYGAMGDTGGDEETGKPPVTPEERELLLTQVRAALSRALNNCCLQVFVLLLVGLFVAKAQNPDVYAAIWVIFPFILIAGLILSCLACTIFCVSEVPDVEFDTGVDSGFAGMQHAQQQDSTEELNQVYTPPLPPTVEEPVIIPVEQMPQGASSSPVLISTDGGTPLQTIDPEEINELD